MTNKRLGYVSLLLSAVLLSLSAFIYLSYAPDNLMFREFGCLSALCLTRADAFCSGFILGFVSLGFAVVLLWEDAVRYGKQLMKSNNND